MTLLLAESGTVSVKGEATLIEAAGDFVDGVSRRAKRTFRSPPPSLACRLKQKGNRMSTRLKRVSVLDHQIPEPKLQSSLSSDEALALFVALKRRPAPPPDDPIWADAKPGDILPTDSVHEAARKYKAMLQPKKKWR